MQLANETDPPALDHADAVRTAGASPGFRCPRPPTDPRSGRTGCVSLLLRPDLERRLIDYPQVVEGAKHGGAVAGDPGVAPQVPQGPPLQRRQVRDPRVVAVQLG